MRESGLFRNLGRFFTIFSQDAVSAELALQFQSSLDDIESCKSICGAREGLKDIYEQAVKVVEREAAASGYREDLLQLQRALYVELEYLLSFGDSDPRHHFLIVIPVADRPGLLRSCLESLIEQCRAFQYGSFSVQEDGLPVYNKITVFILDDSRDETNREKISNLSSELHSSGIRTHYIGLDEQSEILRQIPSACRAKLTRLLGSNSKAIPPHKGASISRNIAYLYLQAFLTGFREKALIYFLDSDEEFRVRIPRGDTALDISFLNYFYWIDRIFSSSDVEVLTGKVVGDPPVSPSVMLNTFLDDLISYLESLSTYKGADRCAFHGELASCTFSAEYHDMAKLFGYRSISSPRDYHCMLAGDHTLEEGFRGLADIVIDFFYGTHPTRRQLFRYDGDLTKTEKARTVYTGNYVFKASGLRYFIPFADLKLRMAGPTLGRILQVKLGRLFSSVGLPLLHKRTIPACGEKGFRNGVSGGRDAIDLSGEFINQFWGDVMLFSVEQLAKSGYPQRMIELGDMADTVCEVQKTIWDLYRKQQTEVEVKIRRLRDFFASDKHWWNVHPGTQVACDKFLRFCTIAEHNFGPHSASFQKLLGQIREGVFTDKIVEAISSFSKDEYLWNELILSDLAVSSAFQKVTGVSGSD